MFNLVVAIKRHFLILNKNKVKKKIYNVTIVLRLVLTGNYIQYVLINWWEKKNIKKKNKKKISNKPMWQKKKLSEIVTKKKLRTINQWIKY